MKMMPVMSAKVFICPRFDQICCLKVGKDELLDKLLAITISKVIPAIALLKEYEAVESTCTSKVQLLGGEHTGL